MLMAHCEIKGIGSLVLGRPMQSPRGTDEDAAQHDARCWRERAHKDAEGYAAVSAISIQRSLVDAAKRLNHKVPGRRGENYKTAFDCGVDVVADNNVVRVLPATKDADVQGQSIFVPSDGKRGGSNRVWRKFPIFSSWSLKFDARVLDNTISEKVFENHLKAAGLFIGIGSMRKGKGGPNGQFSVVSLSFTRTKDEVEPAVEEPQEVALPVPQQADETSAPKRGKKEKAVAGRV